jgi:hypothetical protein
VGVEPPGRRPREQPARGPESELLGFRNRVVAGVVFTVLYVLTFGVLRGHLVPAVVAGTLGGVLVFLLLRRADERRRRRSR